MHPLLIDPAHVLKGIQDFVTKFAPEKYRSVDAIFESLCISSTLHKG
jgi:hypothetical protein